MNLLVVRTGTKYGPEYVERLIAGVRRNVQIEKIDLFTDQMQDNFEGARKIDVSKYGLPGWWAKMAMFDPELRSTGDALYLDLDTIVLDDLGPLKKIASSVDFSICSSFARQFGNANWPCAYGSCVMTMRSGWGAQIWKRFLERREKMMAAKHGDQKAIELIYPDATILQSILPPTFFLNYRELPQYPDGPRPGSSLVIFGGKSKPANAMQPWVVDAWSRA
jgi:hypothetical protein